MNKLLSIPLILLLVGGSIGFATWQYSEKQRLQTERNQYRQQLDETAERLRQAEDERMRLQAELNDTENKIAELNVKITALEQNITALQKELQDKREDLQMRTGAITVGLSFLWMPSVKSLSSAQNVLQSFKERGGVREMMLGLNGLWHNVGVYFFVFKNEFWNVTQAEDLGLALYPCPLWIRSAQTLYPQNDIPIVVAFDLKYNGVWCFFSTGERVIVLNAPLMLMPHGQRSDSNYDLLTHELVHFILQIKTEIGVVEICGGYPCIPISIEYRSRIQSATSRFQMPLPDES